MNVNRAIDLFFTIGIMYYGVLWCIYGIIFFTVIRQESKNDIDYFLFN